jgi:hypothetical protein
MLGFWAVYAVKQHELHTTLCEGDNAFLVAEDEMQHS